MSVPTRAAEQAVPAQVRWEMRLLVGFVLLCTATVAAAPETAPGLVAYLGICLAATTAVLRGVSRHRPAVHLPWLLLAAAPVLGALGMVSRSLLRGRDSMAVVDDLLTIPAYLLLVAGLMTMVRARRGTSAGSSLDGGLMGLAALMLSYSLLLRPLFAGTELSTSVKVLNALYPALSVMVISVGALLAMTEVGRLRSAWAILGGIGALLFGDVAYALSAAAGETESPVTVANVAYCLCYGLVGVAGLHPSMAELVSPSLQQVRGYRHGRFAAVTVALVAPSVIVASRPLTNLAERAIISGLLCLVAVLVLIRTAMAVNRHARSEQALTEQARRDALTGLPNRFHLAGHLDEALARAAELGHGVAVLYMDLDQFKAVNDTWGHQTGDALLVQVGGRLAAQVRDGELVARVGGDEFVVVAEDVPDVQAAAALAVRLLDAFSERVELGVTTVLPATSIGVALAMPGAGLVTGDDLLRESDIAMYRAKATGQGGFAIFDESMRVELAERLTLERDLREALAGGQLSLSYQPIVDLGTGRTTGFEALMRWTHPVRGPVRPDVFIPVAEETGLIVAMGRWAIREAGERLRSLAEEFDGPLSMSVNLSPRQMRDPLLVPTVAEVLSRLPLPPSALALEITETALMEDGDGVEATITALKELGVRLSADDFGTGYSSLAYLRRFPFDQVKVDRSFVAGVEDGGDDAVIVAAVLSMARALSLTTVAEGVETPGQRDRLRELGADSGQGWLFARPLSAEQARAHLAAERVSVAA